MTPNFFKQFFKINFLKQFLPRKKFTYKICLLKDQVFSLCAGEVHLQNLIDNNEGDLIQVQPKVQVVPLILDVALPPLLDKTVDLIVLQCCGPCCLSAGHKMTCPPSPAGPQPVNQHLFGLVKSFPGRKLSAQMVPTC